MSVLTICDALFYWTYDKLILPQGKLSKGFLLGISVRFKFFNIPSAFCFLLLDIDWL